MKKAIMWWALKDRNGEIFESTIAPTKASSWEHGWYEVIEQLGAEWGSKYNYRWDASMASALRNGYKFCRVKIVEAK